MAAAGTCTSSWNPKQSQGPKRGEAQAEFRGCQIGSSASITAFVDASLYPLEHRRDLKPGAALLLPSRPGNIGHHGVDRLA